MSLRQLHVPVLPSVLSGGSFSAEIFRGSRLLHVLVLPSILTGGSFSPATVACARSTLCSGGPGGG
eukprot:4480319-Alexandrium_andersonii.AAC.1